MYERTTARTYGFVRAFIFMMWGVALLRTPLDVLAGVPAEARKPAGALLLLPLAAWDVVMTPDFLWWLRIGMVGLTVWLCLGLRPYHVPAVVFAGLLTFEQLLLRSFGHVNHSEIIALLCVYALTITPATNGFTFKRRGDQDTSPVYRGSLMVMALLLLMPYCATGAYRATLGFDSLFSSNMAHHLASRSFEASSYGWTLGQAVVDHQWFAMVMQLGLAATTVMEVLAPLCLLSKWFRWAWMLFMLSFHFSMLVLMNLFFWQNILLIILLLSNVNRVISPAVADPKQRQVIYFDGVCGLCNRFVDWVMARDEAQQFMFAPLQGAAAVEANAIQPLEQVHPSSIVYQEDQKLWRKSGGAIRAVARLGGLWGLSLGALLIPRPIRDVAYDVVTRYRYAVFGKREACRIPTPEERARFL